MLQIVTDTASDITQKQAREMNIHVISLPIQFSDGPCPQESEADFRIFYDRLAAANEPPVIGRPSVEGYLQHFKAAKAVGDAFLKPACKA